ncbi:MAG: hypothetical protein WCN87_02770 [Chlamydiota bacterium]
MQKAPHLAFSCLKCREPVSFCIWNEAPVCCDHCQKNYRFSDEITGKLKKFEALCRQIHASEEILGDTAVAIDVGSKQVRVPFRLLLTRLGSVLTLEMGEQKLEITFRTEPLADCISK